MIPDLMPPDDSITMMFPIPPGRGLATQVSNGRILSSPLPPPLPLSPLRFFKLEAGRLSEILGTIPTASDG